MKKITYLFPAILIASILPAIAAPKSKDPVPAKKEAMVSVVEEKTATAEDTSKSEMKTTKVVVGDQKQEEPETTEDGKDINSEELALPDPKEKEEATEEAKEPEGPGFETAQGESVEYLSPYKPKALGIIPPRWRVEEVPEILVANDSVKLSNGDKTTLRVNAYRIVPNNNEGVVPFKEPNFEPEFGIKQTTTLSMILAEHCRKTKTIEIQLEKTAGALEEAISLAAEAAREMEAEKALEKASKKK